MADDERTGDRWEVVGGHSKVEHARKSETGDATMSVYSELWELAQQRKLRHGVLSWISSLLIDELAKQTGPTFGESTVTLYYQELSNKGVTALNIVHARQQLEEYYGVSVGVFADLTGGATLWFHQKVS